VVRHPKSKVESTSLFSITVGIGTLINYDTASKLTRVVLTSKVKLNLFNLEYKVTRVLHMSLSFPKEER
jgi:hypothetical protein